MKGHLFNAAHFSDQLTAMMAQEVGESMFVLEGPSAIAQAKDGGDADEEVPVLSWDFSAWMGQIRADFDSDEAADSVERFLREEEFTTIAALSRLEDKDLPTEWKNGRKRVLLTSAAAVKKGHSKARSKDSKKRVRDSDGVVEYRCASCSWNARHQNASYECHNHKFHKEHFSAAIRELIQQETAACEVKGQSDSVADAKMAVDEGKPEADECAGEEQDEQDDLHGGGEVLHEGHEEEEDDEDERSKRRRAGDDAVDLQTFERSVVVTEGRPEDEPKFL